VAVTRQAEAPGSMRLRFFLILAINDQGGVMTPFLDGSLARAKRCIGLAAWALGLAVATTAAWAAGNEGAVLSLGDSVVYGYIEGDGPAYANPANFIGYPELVGHALRLDVVNPSCPGETTAGFLSATGADNGCRPFRALAPLHERYSGTQFDFALAYLGANKRKTKLVTISLGANDGFLLVDECSRTPDPTACINSGLHDKLAAVHANLNTALSSLRATGYKGVLMVVNYYATDYTDPAGTGLTVALNNMLAAAAAANGAVVADAFTAFYKAAQVAGGKTCYAGLLNGAPSSSTDCDVHPSISGQRLLARTVLSAYQAVVH
jgi:lysophospholipase L1-like esterase